MTKILHYHSKLKQRASYLRRNPTLSEKIVWRHLKAKQLGVRFIRQKPIGNYIGDFYCKQLALIIELDGDSHATKISYDANRQDWLASQDLTVIRFIDNDVITNLDGILNEIIKVIQESKNNS